MRILVVEDDVTLARHLGARVADIAVRLARTAPR